MALIKQTLKIYTHDPMSLGKQRSIVLYVLAVIPVLITISVNLNMESKKADNVSERGFQSCTLCLQLNTILFKLQ